MRPDYFFLIDLKPCAHFEISFPGFTFSSIAILDIFTIFYQKNVLQFARKL